MDPRDRIRGGHVLDGEQEPPPPSHFNPGVTS